MHAVAPDVIDPEDDVPQGRSAESGVMSFDLSEHEDWAPHLTDVEAALRRLEDVVRKWRGKGGEVVLDLALVPEDVGAGSLFRELQVPGTLLRTLVDLEVELVVTLYGIGEGLDEDHARWLLDAYRAWLRRKERREEP